jgi:hypothetical protein
MNCILYTRNPNLPEITDKRYHTSCMTSMRIECSTLVVIALITTNFTIIPTQSTYNKKKYSGMYIYSSMPAK